MDEVADAERHFLLKSLIKLQESHNLKLLISSRAEYDITLYLSLHCETIQVHESNSQDLSDYIEYRVNNRLAGLDPGVEFISELTRLTKKITLKSKGGIYCVRNLQIFNTTD